MLALHTKSTLTSKHPTVSYAQRMRYLFCCPQTTTIFSYNGISHLKFKRKQPLVIISLIRKMVNIKPYPLPFGAEKTVNDEVDKMLKMSRKLLDREIRYSTI